MSKAEADSPASPIPPSPPDFAVGLAFCYGTLKKGFYNHTALSEKGKSQFVAVSSTVEQHPFVLHPLFGFPYVLPKTMSSAEFNKFSITGEVWAVDQTCLDALDALERVPSHYVREDVALNLTLPESWSKKLGAPQIYIKTDTSDPALRAWDDVPNGDYDEDVHKAYVPVPDRIRVIGPRWCEAAGKGDLLQVKDLLRSWPPLLNCTDKDGWTALHWAAASARKEVVEFLLEEGADTEIAPAGVSVHVVVRTVELAALIKRHAPPEAQEQSR